MSSPGQEPSPQTPAPAIRLESAPGESAPLPDGLAPLYGLAPPDGKAAPDGLAGLDGQASVQEPGTLVPPEITGPPELSAAGQPRIQPAPSPAACVIPPPQGIDRERRWLREAMTQQYDEAANFVLRMLSQTPGLRADPRGPAQDLLTDLVAARLYLTGAAQRVDDAIRNAAPGPHVPFGRCVTAGLRRLPSYRGPARLRATLAEAEWRWYGGRELLTEWAFCPALAAGHIPLPGDVDFLIWSLTARRAAMLEPNVRSQVLFLPGTSFKVLRLRDGEPREVLLREVAAAEVGADGQLRPESGRLDDMALAGLDQAIDIWRAEPGEDLPPGYAHRFASPPGLITVGSARTPGHGAPGQAVA